MKEELLRSNYFHGDETRIQVIDEPDQKGSTQNWMWVYLTDEYSGSPRMFFFGMKGRGPDTIRRNSLKISSRGISPVMVIRHTIVFRKGSLRQAAWLMRGADLMKP